MELAAPRPTNRFLIQQRDRHWAHVLSATLLLAGLLVAVLFLVGWPRLKSTTIHYDLLRLRAEVTELEQRERSLRLQLERRRAPLELEASARSLGLEPPAAESLVAGEAP